MWTYTVAFVCLEVMEQCMKVSMDIWRERTMLDYECHWQLFQVCAFPFYYNLCRLLSFHAY